MSVRASDYASYEDYEDARYEADADRIEDARREEAEEEFDRVAETCSHCGERWDPRWHRATRTDPAYCEVTECPACGGEPAEGEPTSEPEPITEPEVASTPSAWVTRDWDPVPDEEVF